MPTIYHALTPLIWDTTDSSIPSWRVPTGCRLGMDMRGIADQGMLGTHGNWPYAYVLSESPIVGSDVIHLGEGRADEVNIEASAIRDAIETAFGYRPEQTTWLDCLWHLLTDGASPDGSVPLKPLDQDASGNLALPLPYHSIVRQRPFGAWNPAGNRHHSVIRDLLRLDLKRLEAEIKDEQKRLQQEILADQRAGRGAEANRKKAWKDREAGHAGRALTAMARKYGTTSSDISSTIVPLTPHTQINDDFDRANADALGTATVGGVSQGWSWTEVSGDIDISGNKAAATTTSAARAEYSLSSSDHYVACPVEGPYPGVCNRFSSSEETFYLVLWRTYTACWQIFKCITGSFTELESWSGSYAPPATVKLKSSGSTHYGWSGANAIGDHPDPAISGNYRCGIRGSDTSDRWVSFLADDEVAAGGVCPFAGNKTGNKWGGRCK